MVATATRCNRDTGCRLLQRGVTAIDIDHILKIIVDFHQDKKAQDISFGCRQLQGRCKSRQVVAERALRIFPLDLYLTVMMPCPCHNFLVRYLFVAQQLGDAG